MPSEPSPDEGEQYASSQDSDFALDDAPEGASDDSDSDSENARAGGEAKRKRSKPDSQAQDDGYDNSGDEAIISRGHKKRKRAHEKGLASGEDDEAGEGGLVKTRAQRAAQKEERKYAAANNEPTTVDVDALWAQMISGEQSGSREAATDDDLDKPAVASDGPEMDGSKGSSDKVQGGTVRIKRTYNFAGRVHTEEKVVARDSAEAKLYLASQEDEGSKENTSPTKRATRKAFRSAFEPIIDHGPGRTDLNLGLAARIQAGKDAQTKKLNTVEKSKLDWAGYVDQEGIKDELDLASKSKDSFTARQDFLARSEAIREDDARRARMAGRA